MRSASGDIDAHDYSGNSLHPPQAPSDEQRPSYCEIVSSSQKLNEKHPSIAFEKKIEDGRHIDSLTACPRKTKYRCRHQEKC
jgi:hypothetical protein